MFKKFTIDKQVEGVKENTIIIEYPEDTPNEVIEKDFTDWIFGQIDAGISEPEMGRCKICSGEELVGNLEVNEGLCNDCYNDENPF
ncbi:hypothetical protein QBE53_06005 [Vallitaleaceae bacterium 9-2]